MVSRHRKMWLGLLAFAICLMLLKIFAPLSGTLDAIFSLVFIAIMGTYACVGIWEERRERRAGQSA